MAEVAPKVEETKEVPLSAAVEHNLIAPNTVMVTADDAAGRLLLFPTTVMKCLQLAGTLNSDKEMEQVVEGMKKQAADNPIMLVMSKTGDSSLNFEVEAYELDDKFWAWFKAAAADEFRLSSIMELCKTKMRKILQEQIKQADVPKALDDDKWQPWEQNQIDCLRLAASNVLDSELKITASFEDEEADTAGLPFERRAAAVVMSEAFAFTVLHEHLDKLALVSLDQEVFGPAAADDLEDLR